MAWIKRNLFLVIGGVVALALLGFAGYFFYTKYSEDQGVTEQLNQSTTDLKTLVNRDPHPGTDKVNNIGSAKAEHKKLLASLNQIKRYFQATFTNQPSSRELRAMLDNAVAELHSSAERSAVKLPEDYWFSFTAQKASTAFSTNIIGTLAAQLMDVYDLCHILFHSRIVSLDKIKRVSAGQDDGGGGSSLTSMVGGSSDDYVDAKAVTNQWAVVMPYEVTFQAFSSELADVLEGLIRSRQCFVVKNLTVERADAEPSIDPTTGLPSGTTSSESQPAFNPYARYGGINPMMNPRMRGMSPELMRRYGLGAPMGAAPTAPKPASRPGVLLEEKALRFTLSINSVRLKPSTGK
ncbi:MAG: hypothetical protein HYY23_01745 [Verrucomicrobia bacterium]|nr:hypothetical protein [Verrucomicrobiota bacterium]